MDTITDTLSAGPVSIERQKVAPGRSRISSRSLLPGVDGRSAWTRRCKDLIVDLINDKGGDNNTSVAERALIRRASVLITECERFEIQFASSGFASMDDLSAYCSVANTLRRLLATVGLQRRSRDVTPSLADILREEHHGVDTLINPGANHG
jgi:hypothetical protein